MKKLYTVLAVIYICAAYAQTGQAVLSGVIKNTTKDTLYIRSETSKIAIVPNAKGAFKETIEVAQPGLYELYYGEEGSALFLKAGYDLTIDVDAADFSKTLTFKGKGEKENTFLHMASQDVDPTDTQFGTKMGMMYMALDKDFHDILNKQVEDDKEAARKNKEARGALKKLNGTMSLQFAYENFKGGITKLKDFKGKYVYIDVWATWCGPCRMEIPHLQDIEKKYHGKKIVFVSISVDKKKDQEKWKKMVADKSLGGTQLFADKDWDSDFIKAYGINSIPRFILIGPDGTIVDADAKRPSDPELQVQLDSLLK